MPNAEKRTRAYFWIEHPKGIVPRQPDHETEPRISSAGAKKLKYEIPEQMVIGRQAGVALQIDHPRLHKRHFRVTKKKHSYKFRTYPRAEVRHNGVVTNEGILAPGDEVEIGPIRFTFHVESVAAEPDTSRPAPTLGADESRTEADSIPVAAAVAVDADPSESETEEADTLPAPPITDNAWPPRPAPQLREATPAPDQARRSRPFVKLAVVGLLCAGLGYVLASLPDMLDSTSTRQESLSSEASLAQANNSGAALATSGEPAALGTGRVTSDSGGKEIGGPGTAESIAGTSNRATAETNRTDDDKRVVSLSVANAASEHDDALLPTSDRKPTSTEQDVQSVPLPSSRPAPTSRPTGDAKGLAALEFEKMRARERAAKAWEKRKLEIAKQYQLRDDWNQKGRAVRQLAAYLEHDEWAMRAMGVVVLVANEDSRSLIEILPALNDSLPIVRAMTLQTLRDVPIDRFRRAAGGTEIIDAIVELLSNGKLLQRYSQQLLSDLAGKRLSSKKAVAAWWELEKPRFTGTPKPFDLAQFTASELRRYRDEKGLRQGGTGVVRELDEKELFPTALLELRTHGLDLAICLDVTGSMQSVIDEAISEVETLGAILSSIVGNCRIGLVSYRDEVATTLPLTYDWKHFKGVLQSQLASGGGDVPEAIEKALKVALSRKMNWRATASNHIVVVGDAPPSDPRQCLRLAAQAKNFDIPIHAIFPRNAVREIEEFVEESGGETTRLSNSNEFLASVLSLIFGKRLEHHMGTFIKKYMAIAVDLNWFSN